MVSQPTHFCVVINVHTTAECCNCVTLLQNTTSLCLSDINLTMMPNFAENIIERLWMPSYSWLGKLFEGMSQCACGGTPLLLFCIFAFLPDRFVDPNFASIYVSAACITSISCLASFVFGPYWYRFEMNVLVVGIASAHHSSVDANLYNPSFVFICGLTSFASTCLWVMRQHCDICFWVFDTANNYKFNQAVYDVMRLAVMLFSLLVRPGLKKFIHSDGQDVNTEDSWNASPIRHTHLGSMVGTYGTTVTGPH